MPEGLKTLTRYTIEEEHRHPNSTGDFSGLLNALATAIKIVANNVNRGALVGSQRVAGTPGNDVDKNLSVLGNAVIIRETQWAGHLAAMLSGEMDDIYPVPERYRRGKYLLAFNPLEGSGNLDLNMSLGSIFSILRCPDTGSEPQAEDFLQPGTEQVCAGIALYGPATMMVLTTGRGVDGFTLDREIGAFVLSHPQMRIPEHSDEFAINACNERFWEQPVKRYIKECLDGAAGRRGRDFTMRWVESLVAETFRILTVGGVYLDPRETKDEGRSGRLRMLYEANPIAFLIQQAGGAASTGNERILDRTPKDLHERVPLIFGSRKEVERLERYHAEYLDGMVGSFDASLFTARSLFRTV